MIAIRYKVFWSWYVAVIREQRLYGDRLLFVDTSYGGKARRYV
jgi:hypothetical protein